MGSVSTITPRVTRPAAISAFRGRVWRRSLRALGISRLASVAEFFIPYHLYRVIVSDRGRVRWKSEWAFDAISGTLDPIDLEGASIGSASDALVRSTPEVQLPSREVERGLADRVRRAAYSSIGAFGLRSPEMTTCLIHPGIYIPYWLGVYRHRHQADFEVLNALTGGFEGGKVRAIVADWLKEQPPRSFVASHPETAGC